MWLYFLSHLCIDSNCCSLVFSLALRHFFVYRERITFRRWVESNFLLPLFIASRIQQLFMEFLTNSRQLRWLSCSFMLGLVTPCSLASLSNPSAETLQHLSLLDHQLGMYSPQECTPHS